MDFKTASKRIRDIDDAELDTVPSKCWSEQEKEWWAADVAQEKERRARVSSAYAAFEQTDEAKFIYGKK